VCAEERQALVAHVAGGSSCQLWLERQPTLRGLPSSRGTGALLSDDEATLLAPGRTAPPARSETALPPKPQPAVASPAAFGRYKVLRPLGSGGFGTVYLCEDAELSRQVAVKVCRSGRDTTASEAERFLEEARRLARLSHPGIVAVYDVGVHEGSVYVVSAFLEGSDLARWLKENRPTWTQSTRIVAAIADAL